MIPQTAEPETPSSTPFVGLDTWPSVSSVVPVVRWAILIKHKPVLTLDRVHIVRSAFKDNWHDWKERYRVKVAEITGHSVDQLVFHVDDYVRLKWDGDTPMIDLPRLYTINGADRPLDVRNCIALCIKDFSSKIWTRLGLPFHSAEHFCAVDQLSYKVQTFRTWARQIAEWFHEEFLSIAKQALGGVKNTTGASMEVTTVGLKIADEWNDEALERWLFETDGRPNLRNAQLRAFLADAASFELHPDHLGQENDSFWFVVPATVQSAEGSLLSRKVLYLIRHVGGIAQIVGIGLDDSQAGELASLAALKVSRLVAGMS